MKISELIARVIIMAAITLFSPQMLAWDNGIFMSRPSGGDHARGGVLEIQYQITRQDIRPGSDVVFRLMRGDEEFARITDKPPAGDSGSINMLHSVRLPLPTGLPLTAPPFGDMNYFISAEAELDHPWEYTSDEPSPRLTHVGRSTYFNILPLTSMWLGEVNGIRVIQPAGEEKIVPGGTMTVRYEYERARTHPRDNVSITLLDTLGWQRHARYGETGGAGTDIVIQIPEDIPESENGYVVNVTAMDNSPSGTNPWGLSAAFSIQRPTAIFTGPDPDYGGKIFPEKGVINREPELEVLQPENNQHYDTNLYLDEDMWCRWVDEFTTATRCGAVERLRTILTEYWAHVYRRWPDYYEGDTPIQFKWRFYPGIDNVIPAQWDITLLEPVNYPNYPDALDGPYEPYYKLHEGNRYASHLPYTSMPWLRPGLHVTKGIEKQRTFYEYTVVWDHHLSFLAGHLKFRVTGLDFADDSEKHFTLGGSFDLHAGKIYLGDSDRTLKIDVGLRSPYLWPLPNGPIDFLVELMPDLQYADWFNELDWDNRDEWWFPLDSWQLSRSVANNRKLSLGDREYEWDTVDLGTVPLGSSYAQMSADESCGVWYRVTVDSSDRVPESEVAGRGESDNTALGRIFLEPNDGAVKLTDARGRALDGNTASMGNFNLWIHNCGYETNSGALTVRQRGCWDDSPPGSLRAWGVCQDHDFVDLFSTRTIELPPAGRLRWRGGQIEVFSPLYHGIRVPVPHQEHFEGEIEITFEGDFANWIPEDQNPMLINYVRDTE